VASDQWLEMGFFATEERFFGHGRHAESSGRQQYFAGVPADARKGFFNRHFPCISVTSVAKKFRAEGIFSIRNNERNETDEICILKMFVYFAPVLRPNNISLFRMKKKGFLPRTEGANDAE